MTEMDMEQKENVLQSHMEYIKRQREASQRVREYRSELARQETPRALYELIEKQGKQQIELLEKILDKLERK